MGPVGVVRSPVTVILLSIVTLGIYSLYWQYVIFRELKDHTGTGIGGGIGLLLAFLAAIVNAFLIPGEVANMYRAEGMGSPISAATGFWVFLPLVGTIIWAVKTQTAINYHWQLHGA